MRRRLCARTPGGQVQREHAAHPRRALQRDLAAQDAGAVRRLLRTHGLRDQPLSQAFDSRSRTIQFTTSTYSRNTIDCDRLAEALRAHPAVVSYTMLLIEDTGATAMPERDG